jgi:hypothetical protein
MHETLYTIFGSLGVKVQCGFVKGGGCARTCTKSLNLSIFGCESTVWICKWWWMHKSLHTIFEYFGYESIV